MSSHTSLDRSFPAALALESLTLGPCILTAPTLVAQPQRLIFLKLRYAKSCSLYHIRRVNPYVEQITGEPLTGQVSQSAQWAVSGA